MSIRSLGLFAALAMLLFSSSAGASTATTPPKKGKVASAPAARPAARSVQRSPAGIPSLTAGSHSHDIEQEMKITGQARNLSMGLLFQKDKDKLSFGTARTNYKDKISNF
jgi:hypothetical protein